MIKLNRSSFILKHIHHTRSVYRFILHLWKWEWNRYEPNLASGCWLIMKNHMKVHTRDFYRFSSIWFIFERYWKWKMTVAIGEFASLAKIVQTCENAIFHWPIVFRVNWVEQPAEGNIHNDNIDRTNPTITSLFWFLVTYSGFVLDAHVPFSNKSIIPTTIKSIDRLWSKKTWSFLLNCFSGSISTMNRWIYHQKYQKRFD